MKKLSDYKGEEAIELWGELIEPVSKILADKEVASAYQAKKPIVLLAKAILKGHKEEVNEIFTIIDPDTEIDGFSVVLRLVGVLAEIGNNPDLLSFFGFAEQEHTESEFTGSATESTGDGVQ